VGVKRDVEQCVPFRLLDDLELLELLPELLDRFTGGSQVSKSAEKKAEDLMKGAEPEITIEELD